MKLKDIPEEITSSSLLGECVGWACVEVLLNEFPESDIKDRMIILMDKRRSELLEMEL